MSVSQRAVETREPVKTVYLIGPQVTGDNQLSNLLQSHEWNVICFASAQDALDASCNLPLPQLATTLFVLHEFLTPDYKLLASSKPPKSIIGSPVLCKWLTMMSLNKQDGSNSYQSSSPASIFNRQKSYSESTRPVPRIITIDPGRHLHNFHLKDLSLTFYGLKDKAEADKYIGLCRWMGAKIHKDFNGNKIDIVISVKNETKGDKYRWAVHFDKPILQIGWIDWVWSNRFNLDLNPTSKEVMKRFEVKPLAGLKLSFINFTEKDQLELIQVTNANGGQVVNCQDSTCTHIVIDTIKGEEHTVIFDFKSLTNLSSLNVVYKLWFWSSIELGARADESQEDHAYPVTGARNSSNKAVRSSTDGCLSPKNLDFSYSFTSPTILTKSFFDTSILSSSTNLPKPIDQLKATDRFKVCYELLDTERNYLRILNAIVNVFQKPLEELDYLSQTEMKHIFSNVPPLIDVHEQIHSQLKDLIEVNWKEDNNIAKVFTAHGRTLLKVYPAFVNFFEDTKSIILNAQAKSPKFHAFLKRCESHPECQRQSLQELLITPVQRLPRYLLLLEAIRKKTNESIPDYQGLSDAIVTIEDVLTHINEDKRKTEGHTLMFEVVKDIEGGELLLSARRSFVAKVDAKLIVRGDNSTPVFYKGHTITLFLFNDMLEVCKKRTVKRTDSFTSRASFKSTPNKAGPSTTTAKKSYRHIETIPFASIKSLFYFNESGTAFDDAVLIQTKELTTDAKILKSFPFYISSGRTEFVKKFRMYFNRMIQDEPEQCPQNAEITARVGSILTQFAKGSPADLGAFDFSYAEQLASSLSKSSFSNKARARLTRTFSVSRRQSFLHLGQSENKNSPVFHSTKRRSPSPSISPLSLS